MATKSAKNKPAARTRTKAEVSAEFDEIRSQQPEELDRVSRDAREMERERVIHNTTGLKIDTLVRDVVALGPVIQSQLLQVTTLLTEKKQQLDDLTAAVVIEEENLRNVHNIEVSATALENLKAEYSAKDEELKKNIEALSHKYAELNESLNQSYMDRQRDLETARIREAADFKYNLELTRTKGQRMYDQALEDEKRANLLKQQELEAGWTKRNDALVAQEKELADFKTKVAGFDEEVRKAVSKAEVIAINITKRDLEHKHELEKRDLTGEISLLKMQQSQADKDKEAMAKSILDLQIQLAAANKQVENIATKALESASGNLAMTKMQGVIEQTAAPNGGKRS